MMDDLISRKAAIDVIRWVLNTSIGFTCELEEMIGAIETLPVIPFVPIDKLCELCEEVDASVPCLLCKKIMPEWCKLNNNPFSSRDKEVKCPSWEQLMTRFIDFLRTSK